MKSHFSFVVLPALLLSAATVAAQNQTEPPPAPKAAVIKLGTGFDYSTGDYGFTQDTEVFSVPLNLSYEPERWAFRATLPHMTIKGPASVVAGTTPTAAPVRPTTRKESGLGDLVLAATYHARPVPGQLNVDLTTRVKVPTANEARGLGTGKTDVYAQFDLYQSFGNITPFFNAGYRFLGSDNTYPLKDGFYASAGAGFRVTDATVVGGVLDWRSKIIDGAPDAKDVIAFFSTNMNERWNVLGYGLAGFNDAAPKVGFGGALTYRF